MRFNTTDGEKMKGIDFITDDKGRKKAAIIDLKKYGNEFEGFIDGMIANRRLKTQRPKRDLSALQRRLQKL